MCAQRGQAAWAALDVRSIQISHSLIRRNSRIRQPHIRPRCGAADAHEMRLTPTFTAQWHTPGLRAKFLIANICLFRRVYKNYYIVIIQYREERKTSATGRMELQLFCTKVRDCFPALFSDPFFDVVEAPERYAHARNRSLGEFALAWVVSRPWVASVITAEYAFKWPSVGHYRWHATRCQTGRPFKRVKGNNVSLRGLRVLPKFSSMPGDDIHYFR
jgi:hypothetical protein